MAEKIVNGLFPTGLVSWSNVGAKAFVWSAGAAKGTSAINSALVYSFRLTQSFSKYQAVRSAILNVQALYHSAAGDTDGSNRFLIRLRKPSGVAVDLFDATYSGLFDDQTQVCDDLDVSAHMTENGVYFLELSLYSASAFFSPGTYLQSYGSYDNVSMAVVERYSKVVSEALGSGEFPEKSMLSGASEGVSLSESIAHVGWTAGAGFFFSAVGLAEFVMRALTVAKTSIVGLVDTLTRTYGYRQRAFPGGTERVGVSEYLEVVFPSGNVIKFKILKGAAPVIWINRVPVTVFYEE